MKEGGFESSPQSPNPHSMTLTNSGFVAAKPGRRCCKQVNGGRRKMMEATAVGMGLLMMAVAVAVGGLVLEATLLVLGRALQSPPLAASLSLAPSVRWKERSMR